MKTIEIEIALMRYLGIRTNLIVPNVSWGIAGLHECDILSLSASNYATEIEIKVTKYDLLKDKEKAHNHVHNHITYFYYAVPEGLEDIALESIPGRAGLYVITCNLNTYDPSLVGHEVKLIRKCQRNGAAIKWSEKERHQLARLGAMRILGLKIKANEHKDLTLKG